MIKVVFKNENNIAREVLFNFSGYSDKQINSVLQSVKLNGERIAEITEVDNVTSN